MNKYMLILIFTTDWRADMGSVGGMTSQVIYGDDKQALEVTASIISSSMTEVGVATQYSIVPTAVQQEVGIPDAIKVPDEVLSYLRGLRLAHWENLIRCRKNSHDSVTQPERDGYNQIANEHLKKVQLLNVFFDTPHGDTAEQDLEKYNLEKQNAGN